MTAKFLIKTLFLGLVLSMSTQMTSYGQTSSVEEVLESIRTEAKQRKPQAESNVSGEYRQFLRQFRAYCYDQDYPYGKWSLNQPRMHGLKFLALSDELPFLEETYPRYSQFWIDTDVVNVRSGPSQQHEIVSETYYGNLEFIYARKGDWVAISPPYKSKHTELNSGWVHMKYLSANRITGQVAPSVLKGKCDFQTYGKLEKEKLFSHAYHTNSLCASVLKYLRHQRLLSGKAHTYWQEYEAWRISQKFPEKYNPQLC